MIKELFTLALPILYRLPGMHHKDPAGANFGVLQGPAALHKEAYYVGPAAIGQAMGVKYGSVAHQRRIKA